MALKRRSIQQLYYSMAMQEPQESVENQFKMPHIMIFELDLYVMSLTTFPHK